MRPNANAPGMALPGPALTSRRWVARLGLLSGALLLACALGLSSGTELLNFNGLWGLVTGKHYDATRSLIFWNVRLPRVILAGFVGGALGISGAVLQVLLRNPLAEPYILGVSSGSAIGAYAALFIGFQFSFLGLTTISIFALIGGLAAAWIVYLAARVNGELPVMSLILAGVVVNAMLSAVILFAVSILEAGQVMNVMIWLLGHIRSLDQVPLLMVTGYILIGTLLIIREAGPLNALVLGEESAWTMGIQVNRLKRRLILLTAFLTAVAVSVSGLIGFIGIIIPHTIRFLWGPDHRLLLPASFLLGATGLILADTAARTLMQPAELPVGIITAIGGGPFFLILLRMRRTYG